MIKEKKLLKDILERLPEHHIIELIRYAQFLEHQNKSSEIIKISETSKKIIDEDKNLLKRLAQ